MNNQPLNLPTRSSQKQPMQSKAQPPVKSLFEKFATDDDRRFERGYN